MTPAARLTVGSMLGLLLLAGCGGSDDGGGDCDPIAATLVSRIELAPATVSVADGETAQLTARAFSCDGSQLTTPFTWESSDATTVSVSPSGLVSGVKIGGPVTVKAAAQGKQGTAAVSVVGRAAVALRFVVQPSDADAGTAIAPAVQVELLDAQGDRVSSATPEVSLAMGSNSNGAVLNGDTSVDAVNGVATFSGLSINQAGSGYTLVARSAGLTGATSVGFEVFAGGPAALAFVRQPGTTSAGVAIAPAVQVSIRDAFGNPVTNAQTVITISLGNNPGGATLHGTAVVTTTGGTATFGDLALERSGSGYTLVASAPGLAGATSRGFDVTPGQAERIAFAQQPSRIEEGTPFNPEVVVEVQDAFGNRVTSATGSVTLVVRNSSGGGAPTGTVLVGGGARSLAGGAATYTGMTVNVTFTRTLTLRASMSGFPNVLSEPFQVMLVF